MGSPPSQTHSFATRFRRLVAAGAAALALAAPATQAQRETPHVVERQARRAVEGGRIDSLRALWTARLRAAQNDRAAALGLAALSDLGYDYRGAAVRYRALVDTLAAPTDQYTAYAQLAWGRMDELRGAMSDAEVRYPLARALARRTGDRVAEAMVLASQSFLRANAVSLESGLATLDSADRLLGAEAVPDIRSDFARRRATLLAVQLAPTARATAELAIRLARRAGDRRAEANAMRALALHHRMRSFPDSARAALDTTATLQRAARDRRALAETLTRIANEFLGERRLGDARSMLLEARSEALASHNDFALASSETGLGAVALRVHDLPAAIEHLKRAEALNLAAKDTASLVVVQNYQVMALLDAGLLDSAWALQRAVLAHYERSSEIPEMVVSHRVLANIALAQRRYELAGLELDSAEALIRGADIPAARPPLWFDRARLAHRTGRDRDAVSLLTRYLASLRPDDGVARWDSEVHLAEIDARQGRAPEAARRLTAATAALELWRNSQTDSSLRLLAFQASTHEESDRDAYFAAAISALSERGQVEAAFEQAERRRARTLAERIVQAEAMRANASSRAPRSGVLTAASARDIAAALPDEETALLQYVTGGFGAPTTLFVITRSGVRAVRLASVDSLLTPIRRLLGAIESGGEAKSEASILGAALVEPAIHLLSARVQRLVIAPDGALHRVPFDALRLANGQVVLERFETALVPSASVGMLLWRRPAVVRGRAPRVLAFGDPTTALARLPESGREARIVAGYGDESVLRLREAASGAYLKQAPLGSFSVLHLATHAVVDERSLARSGVVLAPAGRDSGFVSPGDLAALSLGVDLVVLSACRSAGGVLVRGEGVQGLTASLLAAGARSVVATGWPVDDRQTVQLVENFYAALSTGEPVGMALRTAKLAALRRGAPARDWASFSVIGDPFVRVPLSAPRGAPALAVLGVVVLAGGTLAAYRRYRRT
jgi:CHAT domain-containing protein